jgi:ribosomal protein L11 methyltransferase
LTEKKYYEIEISCAKSVSETICSFLVEHGALGAVEENVFVDRVKKNRHDINIKGYFKSEKDFLKIKDELKLFLGELKKNLPDFKGYKIRSKLLKDKNWRESYKRYFKPVKVSKRIVVKPDYEEYTAKGSEKVILINPEMAFGIGNHPTTKMCIKYMDEMLMNRTDADCLSMLDAGTGSGIIAIAAAFLGMRNIYGFDIDKTAYDTACENIRKNGVEDLVKLGCHGIKMVKGEYDIVIANILANILIYIKDDLIKLTSKGGDLILSGILEAEKDMVVKAFSSNPDVVLLSSKREGEWKALRFKKRCGP